MMKNYDFDRLYTLFGQYPCIGTDTRKDLRGCIFWALKGEHFDANDFIDRALDQGAVAVVTNNPRWEHDPRAFYLRGDTLEALQDFAREHRLRMPADVIAVTGSNGKTTTKELMASVLRQQFRTVATEGNLNNHIGVPLMLLRIRPDTEKAVIEMGTNHFGEIEKLVSIALPDYGYITGFGEAHLEFFKDLNGVIREKTALYRYLRKAGKTAFIHFDDPVQEEKSRHMKRYGFSFEGHPEARVILEKIPGEDTATLRLGDTLIRSHLVGDFHTVNMGGAIAAGTYFDIEPELIKKGIESYVPRNNRSQILQKDSLRIILDAYNANPTSMRAALENLARYPGPKTAVLGDMLELGESAAQKHAEIARLAAQLQIPVYLIGRHFQQVPDNSFIKAKFTDTQAFIESGIFDKLDEGTVLLKGSRGLKLERILEKGH
ncbi:MAG: UDP-N-acetylmuramoyl-tripeptide--D-alanyl-D-alanine ligase [Chlorobi bacterium]|nr:UDP-N-acetylmuramoyl-tripeptide--D-alanyl-D-alanine ligase [Chlorobiota bacterium]